MVQITISHNCFWQWFVAKQVTSHYLKQWHNSLTHVSPGLDELRFLIHLDPEPCNVNPLSSGDVYMLAKWAIIASETGLILVQHPAIITIDNSSSIKTFRTKLQWRWNQNTNHFSQGDAFENDICKMVAILFRLPWVTTREMLLLGSNHINQLSTSFQNIYLISRSVIGTNNQHNYEGQLWLVREAIIHSQFELEPLLLIKSPATNNANLERPH